jgi:acyl-CoA thioesterase-1
MKFSSLRYGLFVGLCNVLLIILLGAASPLRADPKTIVAFGDSLTQGYGLPADAGFVPQMGAWLAAQGASVRMVNAGVSGDTTAGGLARLDWTLAEPADLVIVNLGSNDMLRGLDPNLAYENLKQIMDKLEAKNIATLLIGHLGPLNYGAGYKADYDGAFEKLAASYDTVFYPFFFKMLMAADGVTPNLQLYFQDDGMHPNAAGVQAVVADMGPYVLRALQQ